MPSTSVTSDGDQRPRPEAAAAAREPRSTSMPSRKAPAAASIRTGSLAARRALQVGDGVGRPRHRPDRRRRRPRRAPVAFASGTVTATVSTSTMSPAVTVTSRSCGPGFVDPGRGQDVGRLVRLGRPSSGPPASRPRRRRPGPARSCGSGRGRTSTVPSRGTAVSSKASEAASPRGAMDFETGGGAAPWSCPSWAWAGPASDDGSQHHRAEGGGKSRSTWKGILTFEHRTRACGARRNPTVARLGRAVRYARVRGGLGRASGPTPERPSTSRETSTTCPEASVGRATGPPRMPGTQQDIVPQQVPLHGPEQQLPSSSDSIGPTRRRRSATVHGGGRPVTAGLRHRPHGRGRRRPPSRRAAMARGDHGGHGPRGPGRQTARRRR